MSALIVAPDRLALQVRPSFIQFDFPGSGAGVVMIRDEADELITGDLQLTQAEFTQLGNSLLNTWQNEVGIRRDSDKALQRQVEQPVDRAAEQRVTFAAAGSYPFKMLVEAMSGSVQQLFLDAVEALQSEQHRPVLFMSKSVFPWRLLYAVPGDLFGSVDEDDLDVSDVTVEGFLGLSGVVDHQVPRGAPPGKEPGYRVSAGVHEELQKGSGGHVDIAASLRADPRLVVEFARDERQLAQFIAKDGSPLIYLFCHGQFRDALAGASVQELVFRSSKALTGNELVRRLHRALGPDGHFSTAPITIVNACQGGVFGRPGADTVVDTMRQYGAYATLAPLVNMPLVFGSQFGVAVLRHLVQGEALGEAVLATTRAYATNDRNLLGLTYATVNGRIARLNTQEGAP